MTKESLKIYKQELASNLPSFLTRVRDKLMVVDPVEGRPGPYDVIYDFGWSQEDLKHKVPVNERIASNSKTLIFAELDTPEIASATRRLTEINRDQSPDDDEARLEYQGRLFQVFDLMKPLFQKKVSGRTAFFPPRNGGDLVRAILQELGIIREERNIVDYELKRVLRNDGRLMVGVINNSYPEGPFDTACVLDDCAAAIVSLRTTADIVKTDYPEVEKLTVIVSSATQRGMLRLDEELNEDFNFKSHALFAGSRVFKMSPNYYLLRTEEEGFPEGTQFVGDMGRWAKPLPSSFNDRAPWNIFR